MKRFLLILPVAAILALSGGEAKAGAAAFKTPELGNGDGFQLTAAKKRRRMRRARTRRARTTITRPTITRIGAAAGAAKLGANASLFGTTETRSTKMGLFKKWSGAMAKAVAEQADTKAFAEKFKDWVVFLEPLRDKDAMVQLKAVNAFMNKSKYIQDNKNWGVKDYWASPGEFLDNFGDCEDYAIAKYMALKFLGFDVTKMRIVVIQDLNLKIGHAILAVYIDNRILILDNQIKIVADSRKIRHYKPIYSINEQAWWRHRAPV